MTADQRDPRGDYNSAVAAARSQLEGVMAAASKHYDTQTDQARNDFDQAEHDAWAAMIHGQRIARESFNQAERRAWSVYAEATGEIDLEDLP